MDVRLDVHQQAAVQRLTPGQQRRETGTKADAREAERAAEEQAESVRQAQPAAPQVISREELQQFLLLLGTTRGSEELLSAMVHDASRMRDMLLGGKA